MTPPKGCNIGAVLQGEEEDRFKWDPSNARWVRVKPGKDETGAHKGQPIEISVSSTHHHSVALGTLHSLVDSEVDLFFLPGKYTTDNWEKGGGATITPLSGSPYVVCKPAHVADMCTSSHVAMPQSLHLS